MFVWASQLLGNSFLYSVASFVFRGISNCLESSVVVCDILFRMTVTNRMMEQERGNHEDGEADRMFQVLDVSIRRLSNSNFPVRDSGRTHVIEIPKGLENPVAKGNSQSDTEPIPGSP